MNNFTHADNVAQDKAQGIDKKIRSLLETKSQNNLPISLYLAEMYRDSMYEKLGFKSMKDYMLLLAEDMGIKSARVFGWFNIGKIYLSYQDDLNEAGFAEEHGLSKLRLLKKALEKHEKEDVYRKLLSLSYGDFLNYIKDINKTPLGSPIKDEKNPEPMGAVFSLNGKTAITINGEIDQEVFSYLVRICRLAIRAIRRGEKIYYVRVKNREEFDRFESAFKKLIKQLRRKKTGA